MLSSYLENKPIRDWTYSDFESAVGSEESIGLELKSDLPLKKDAAGWRQKFDLHKSEKEGLGKEIVAFANAFGGNILIGFEESETFPKKAEKLADKLPKVDELVDKLQRSLHATIEPAIEGLEFFAIKETVEDELGYIVIRVPNSLSKPHGLSSPPPSYIRRADRSEPMGMRDMQDRFYEAQTSRQRIDKEIAEFSISKVVPDIKKNSFHVSLTLIPSYPVTFENLLDTIKEPSYSDMVPIMEKPQISKFFDKPYICNWRPYAYGMEAVLEEGSRQFYKQSHWVVKDNGTINVTGEIKGIPTSQYSEEQYDMEINPSTILSSTCDVIGLQTALVEIIGLPSFDWYFVCELQSSHDRTFARIEMEWKDYHQVNLTNPTQLSPIRIKNAYDQDGLELVENKICNSFGLKENPFGKIMQFKSKE